MIQYDKLCFNIFYYLSPLTDHIILKNKIFEYIKDSFRGIALLYLIYLHF